jgi:SAM-dependent methyltransferase
LIESIDTFSEDVAFYLDCVRQFGGPVLELATGTGRVLIPLAEAGHEVAGIDISPAMLRVAREKLERRPELAARVRLVEADMTDFALGREFALALIPARAFQILTEPSAQRATLTRIRKHLRPGGYLVLDLFDPRFELLLAQADSAGLEREARDQATGDLVRRQVLARHVDFLRQTLSETLRIERFDASGKLLEHEETSWTLRWMMRQEVQYLLELCGFAPVAEYSDFRRSPPAYGKEQIWIARAL